MMRLFKAKDGMDITVEVDCATCNICKKKKHNTIISGLTTLWVDTDGFGKKYRRKINPVKKGLPCDCKNEIWLTDRDLLTCSTNVVYEQRIIKLSRKNQPNGKTQE